MHKYNVIGKIIRQSHNRNEDGLQQVAILHLAVYINPIKPI